MEKSKMSLPVQMAIGMVAGIIVGIIVHSMGVSAGWLKPIGQLFITLVRMVVVPLVFTTLVAGAASVSNASSLGRIATKTLVFYFLTTGVAMLIGLLLANFTNPGVGLDLSMEGLKAKEATPPPLLKVLMDIVPLNPIEALASGKMLQIIFFALLFGFGLSLCGEKGKPAVQFFDICADVMIKVTTFVMMYAPIGVFGLMGFTVANHGLAVMMPLIKVIIVMYVACVVHVLIVYMPLVRFTGTTPGKFFKGIAEPLMIAFTTTSSAAALSSNMTSVQKLGASKTVSSFSIPLGNTINMDGTAVYMGVAAIFASQIYGVPLTIESQLSIILLGILASIGSMGVPGAGLIMVSMVFSQVGIPLEAIALIAGIDRIMDMARTSVNVLGDACGALVVTKLEYGKLEENQE